MMRFSNTPRIIVCGGRDLDPELVAEKVAAHAHSFQWLTPTIIQGCATGADFGGTLAAERMEWECLDFPANWGEHGKAAGPIRNQEMIEKGRPNVVLAFWDGKSRGTRDMVTRAASAGVPVLIEPAAEYAKPKVFPRNTHGELPEKEAS